MVLGLGSGPASNQSLGKHMIGSFLAPRYVSRWIGCPMASAGGTDPLEYWPTRLALHCERNGHTLKAWESPVIYRLQGLAACKGAGELHYQVEMKVDTLPWMHTQWFVFAINLVLSM